MKLVRKFVYRPSNNKVIRSVLKPFKPIIPKSLRIPVSGTIKIDTEVNGEIYLRTNQTNFLTKDVFWNGIQGYEFPTIKIFMKIIRNKSTFIDVGANIGYYSLIAAKVNPEIKVWAFEPMPSAFLFLKENISLNKMSDNITPVELAVAADKGEAEFFVTKNPKALYLDHHIGGSSTTARAKDEYSKTINVKLESLDNFVKDNQIKKVDLMKLDTEATEDQVLAGSSHIIERDRPIILCEVLPGRIEEKLESFYREHNYKFFLPEENGLKPLGSLKGHSGEKDYYFVPEEKVDEVSEYIVTH